MTVSTHFYGDGCPDHNRCQDYATQSTGIYHAHDLPPCQEEGVRWVKDRWCCEPIDDPHSGWRIVDDVERIDWNGHCPTCGRLLILTPNGAWWCVTCDGEPAVGRQVRRAGERRD